jgi:hypothetical protein
MSLGSVSCDIASLSNSNSNRNCYDALSINQPHFLAKTFAVAGAAGQAGGFSSWPATPTARASADTTLAGPTG